MPGEFAHTPPLRRRRGKPHTRVFSFGERVTIQPLDIIVDETGPRVREIEVTFERGHDVIVIAMDHEQAIEISRLLLNAATTFLPLEV